MSASPNYLIPIKAQIRTIVQVNQGSGFQTVQVDAYRSQEYQLIHVLFGTTSDWDLYPVMNGAKGFPVDITPTTDAAPGSHNPPQYVNGFYLGNYKFTWYTFDQMQAYPWTTQAIGLGTIYSDGWVIPTAMVTLYDFYNNFFGYLNGICTKYSVQPAQVRCLFGMQVGTL
jgi:hypothetical protein